MLTENFYTLTKFYLSGLRTQANFTNVIGNTITVNPIRSDYPTQEIQEYAPWGLGRLILAGSTSTNSTSTSFSGSYSPGWASQQGNSFYPYEISTDYCVVCLGNGERPLNRQDYTLDSFISTSLDFSHSQIYQTDELNNPELLWTAILTNSSNKTVKISEIGLFKNIISEYHEYRPKYMIMLSRELLTSPISINPTESATLKYRFSSKLNTTYVDAKLL